MSIVETEEQILPPMTAILRSFSRPHTETVRVRHVGGPDELKEIEVEPGPVEIHAIDGSKIAGKIVGEPGATVEIDAGVDGTYIIDVTMIVLVKRAKR